jgi:hypothetical protein
MSTDPSFFDSLDIPDTETAAPEPAPTPAPEAPAPEAAAPAPEAPAPVPTTIEAARDPATGKFVPKPQQEPEHKVIPLAAHLEERTRWKQELQALQERIAKIEKPAAPPEPEPDFVEDPKGYVDAKTAKALEALKQVEQKLEPVQAATEQQHFLQQVAMVEAEFVKTSPDYYDALAHIRQVRAAQLQELYPQATPEQIGQQLMNEEVQTARALMAQGRNPSETMYKLSKTFGYHKAEAPKPQAPALPNVPKAPVADPSATLGSAGAAADTVDENEMAGEDSAEDILTIALRERFKR